MLKQSSISGVEKFKYNLQNIQETTRFRYWFTGRLNIGPDIWSYETVSDKGKIPTRRNSGKGRKTENPSLKLMFLHMFEIFPGIVSENKNDVQKSDYWPLPWCGCWWPQGVKEITSLSYINSIVTECFFTSVRKLTHPNLCIWDFRF